MRKIIILFMVPCVILACKKDKLTGDYAIFEGNWVWIYSIKHTYNYDFNTSIYDTVYATQYQDNYKVEFLKKGKIHFKKNGEVEEKKRVVIDYFRNDGKCSLKNDAYRFVIKLNNNIETVFHGCLNEDSLASKTNINLPTELNNYESYPINVIYTHFYIKE